MGPDADYQCHYGPQPGLEYQKHLTDKPIRGLAEGMHQLQPPKPSSERQGEAPAPAPAPPEPRQASIPPSTWR